MTDDDILDNAPKDAQTISGTTYIKLDDSRDLCEWYKGKWVKLKNENFGEFLSCRAISDIQELVDLRAENEASQVASNREQQIKTLESLIGFAWECGMKGQAGDVVWLSDIQDSINKLRQGGK